MRILSSVKAFRVLSLFAVIILTAVIVHLPPVARMELSAYDMRLEHLGSQKPIDARIQIIGLDEESIQHFDRRGMVWPWPRRIHGKLVDRLSSLGAQSIFFDILFVDPGRDGSESDAYFAQSIKRSGRVVLASKFEKPSEVEKAVPLQPLAALRDGAAGIGHIDVFPDTDGEVRWANLAYLYEGTLRPSADLLLYARMKGVSEGEIRYGESKIQVGSSMIPTDRHYRILINYYYNRRTRGFSEDLAAVRSYYKYLDPSEPVKVKGSLVLIGVSEKTIAGEDKFNTPQGTMLGPIIHANIINTLLNGITLRRSPPLANLLFAIAAAFLLGYFVPRARPLHGFTFSVALVGAVTAVNFLLFRSGWWLDIAGPLLSCLVSFAFVATYQFLRTHRLFGQFVVPEVVDRMLASDREQRLGGEVREVSILFTDIRGYTTLSEKMSPDKVLDLLNEYHSVVVAIYTANDGRVIDYQGDAQMVLFGFPKLREDHAYAAVRAAWQMQKKMDELRGRWEIQNKELFEVGCGITTGEVAIGLAGADDHKQYTAIGDSTNVSARLQSMSKELQSPILIDEKTCRQAGDRITVDVLEPVLLKGKSKPLPVFRVTGVRENLKDGGK